MKLPSTPKAKKALFPDFLKQDAVENIDTESTAFTGYSTSGIS